MKKRFLFSLLFALFTVLYIQAQEAQPWSRSVDLSSHPGLRQGSRVSSYHLDRASLSEALTGSSYRTGKSTSLKQGSVIFFPSPDGGSERYRVVRTRVMSEALAAKFPEILSYKGVSAEHPGRSIYFSLDNGGFHGMILERGRSWYLNPTASGSEEVYLAAKADLSPANSQCMVEDAIVKQATRDAQTMLRTFDDGMLRTFRLALACTGEYAAYHINKANLSGGTDAQKKAAVLAAMNTTMTRVNGVFENDLALTMELIPNNDAIIFLDAATDGLTNDDVSTLLEEIQGVIDNAIGNENYDIGHVFGTGSGGIALGASACTSINKAKGVTGLSSPEGDYFAIDFVAHEMGHQLGATHTFNNSCGGNRWDISAVEPGSGSTIMGYAGICAPNIVGQSDDYFHAISIEQIWNNITNGNSTCAVATSLGNTAPTLNPTLNYVIPAGTPFVLEAEAADADGDPLTYCWEQQDHEIVPDQAPQATATVGPLFRSRPPSDSPNRYFPAPTDLLSNNLAPTWEPLPAVSRDLNFSILVRDNAGTGGQTAREDTKIEVVETAAPFSITSQTTTATLEAGQVQTITWEVGDTDLEPINAAFVDILFVLGNDLDNPVVIEANTPNDGSQEVVIPSGISSDNARIMVRAVDNIFFALNQATLVVEQSGFALDLASLEYSICQPADLEIPFTYITYAGYNETTTFSVTDASPGLSVSFSTATATASNTEVIMTVSNTAEADLGENSFTLVATASGGTVSQYPVTLHLFNDTFEPVQLLSPVINSTGVLLDASLNWEPIPNTVFYQVDLAADPLFETILETASVTNPSYTPEMLQGATTYYWRVRPGNECTQGDFTETFYFTTVTINTATYENKTVIPIPESGTPTVTSTIVVDKEGDLNKLRVGVDISHTYVQDLTLTLTSPNGRSVTLLSFPCGDNDDIVATFDDEGENLSCGTAPAVSGTIIPEEALEAFKGEPILGTWTLTVIDGFNEDGGSINGFSLEIFVNGSFAEDQDRDGVLDENDLCPDTPENTKVDSDGCPLFSLPASNFQVRTEGESCRDREDGQIEITAESSLNYTATLTGNGLNETVAFNTTATFGRLSAGAYQLCFTVDEEPDFQQCFEITIAEPEALSVLSKPDEQAKQLHLELSGADLYFIELNGTTLTTEENAIDLPMKDGLNLLQVSSAKACQGIYKEEFVVGETLSAYPNPVSNTLFLITREKNSVLDLNIYSVTGQRIRNQNTTTNATGKAEADLSDLANGVYILEIKGATTSKTIKLVKQ